MEAIPKLKRDWVGRKVRTKRVLRNGHMEIPAGTVCEVIRNVAGLWLVNPPCECCGVRVFINKVPESDVELLPRE